MILRNLLYKPGNHGFCPLAGDIDGASYALVREGRRVTCLLKLTVNLRKRPSGLIVTLILAGIVV